MTADIDSDESARERNVYEVNSVIRPSPLSYRNSLTLLPLLLLVQFAPLLFYGMKKIPLE